MKRITVVSILLMTVHNLYAQIKIGQPSGNLVFKTILNAPLTKSNLNDLKGKVTLLEFWATWCAPCVEAMTHLQELQKIYKGNFQIVTISDEKEKRIQQFLINRPSNLWFAIDTARNFAEVFPSRSIPHSVLINKNGIVVAITDPYNITAKVIEDVIRGKTINLPVKEDITGDPWKTYFAADDTVQNRFVIQPEIKGIGVASQTYSGNSAFKNRRIAIKNLSLQVIYRFAYGGMPYPRTIDLTPVENAKEYKKLYCMDIIVPKGRENDLLPALRKELTSRFNLRVSIENQLKPVYTLTIADKNKLSKLPRSVTTSGSFGASHGAFTGVGVQLKSIASYLEDFGLVRLPVVDETGDSTMYDIQFTYMPEKKGDLEAVLESIGLKLTQTERKIDMLVFREK